MNIFVAATSDHQQPWLAAVLDFETVIEDLVFSSLLIFIAL